MCGWLNFINFAPNFENVKTLKGMKFIKKPLSDFGDYVMLMGRTFTRPDRFRESFRCYLDELYKLGVSSILIVIVISIFIGALITIQMQLNIMSPSLPRYTVGYSVREIVLLEFSSSIMALILAGKVGSNIASEIGTMRVSEQIDAMEVMGINSANYIILPKIVAMVTYIPLLSAFSMITGLGGAYFVALFTDIMPMSTLTHGFQAYFKEHYIWYALFKTLFFGYIISSVSSYYGYSVKGGSREVGRASTNAVVVSSVLILITDVLLTQIIMG